MKGVRAGKNVRVELAPGGMTKLRRKLRRDQGEFTCRVVWKVNQRTGNRLVIVVDAFDGEVVVARPLASDGRADADANSPCRPATRSE